MKSWFPGVTEKERYCPSAITVAKFGEESSSPEFSVPPNPLAVKFTEESPGPAVADPPEIVVALGSTVAVPVLRSQEMTSVVTIVVAVLVVMRAILDKANLVMRFIVFFLINDELNKLYIYLFVVNRRVYTPNVSFF